MELSQESLIKALGSHSAKNLKFRRNDLNVKAQSKISNNNQVYLAKARQAAHKLAQQKGFVTSDDVVNVVGMPNAPSLVGSIFKGNGFTRIGYTPSTRNSTHGREIGVWRLKSKLLS
jgi:hypothetical protein